MLSLVLGVFGVTSAQDARAQELLQGLTNAPGAQGAPLETFDYTLRYTIYSESTGKTADNLVRFAVDVEQHRLFTESVIGRTPNTRLVYQNGAATAYDLRADETFTPPAELVEPFEKWFEQVAQPDILEQDLAEARYMGEKHYGEIVRYVDEKRSSDVLQGEEVEVTAALPDFLGTSLGRAPVRLLFGPEGEHLASVYTVEGREQLILYSDPKNPDTLPRYLNAHLYELGAEKPFLEAQTRVQNLSVNEPLDRALFELEATAN